MNEEHYSEENELTNRLLDQICEGVDTGEETSDQVSDDWEVDNVVEHEGALYRVNNVETNTVSDDGGESFYSGDDHTFTLEHIETGDTIEVSE